MCAASLHLADTLSRATRPVTNDSKQTNCEVFRLNIDHEECANDGITSKTLTEVKRHKLNDTDLVELTNVVSMGWPEWKSQVPPSVSTYWTFRDELTVSDGILYKGLQVVIPVAMRKKMLQKIHVAHLGPESNIRMCKDIIF